MACSYSLKPLRSVPNLIPACIRILKEQWPLCRADLLPQLVQQELTAAPCSYACVRDPDDAHGVSTLIGHIRLVPLTTGEQAIFAESLSVDKAERGRGLGKMTLRLTEEMVAKIGYAELHLAAYTGHEGFHRRQSYDIRDMLPPTLGANVLLTGVPVSSSSPSYVSWLGNTLYPGLESVYKGGHILTEKELLEGKNGVFYVKYLNN